MKLALGIILAGTSIIALGTSTSAAGWQNTEWGMTVKEVHEAFEDAEPNYDPGHDFNGLKAMLKGSYLLDGMDGAVSFGFEGNELRAVSVSFLGREECMKLQIWSYQAYGESRTTRVLDEVSEVVWKDEDGQNMMTGTTAFVEGSDDRQCTFVYEPLQEPGQPDKI